MDKFLGLPSFWIRFRLKVILKLVFHLKAPVVFAVFTVISCPLENLKVPILLLTEPKTRGGREVDYRIITRHIDLVANNHRFRDMRLLKESDIKADIELFVLLPESGRHCLVGKPFFRSPVFHSTHRMRVRSGMPPGNSRR